LYCIKWSVMQKRLKNTALSKQKVEQLQKIDELSSENRRLAGLIIDFEKDNVKQSNELKSAQQRI